jgi:hypothetical protein
MNQRARTLLGILLIIAGLLVALDVLNIVPGGTSAIWVGIFSVAGLGFLYFYFQDKVSYWWAIIPGLTMFGVAFTIALNLLFPGSAGALGGAVLLLGIALAFWIVYLRDRSAWWPIIPAGVLTSLGILIAISEIIPGEVFAGAFLICIGLTFILVFFLQERSQRQNWMFYPGGILIGIGLILLIATTSSWLIILPALLIIGGGLLIYRVLREPRTAP